MDDPAISGSHLVRQLDRRFSWCGLQLQVVGQDISKRTDWQVHEDNHVVIVHLEGRMDFLETELDGRCNRCGPAVAGEIWSIPAGSRYVSSAVGDFIQYAVLTISPSTFNTLERPQHRLANRLAHPLAGTRDDTLFEQTRRLVQIAMAGDDGSGLAGATLAESIAGRAILTCQAGVRLDRDQDTKLPALTSAQTQALQEYVLNRLGERITLQGLAEFVEMTTHHLLIAFRKAFGTTPAQYLLTQRLRQAQWRLLHTRDDITAIALHTGFSSHSHLTTTFSKRIGMPPSEFRTRFR